MKNKVFWWEIDKSLSPKNFFIFPKEVDFLVVGGGYTGMTAGLFIAKNGKSVVVLDSGKPGFGASTRNGGICSGQIRLSHKDLCKKYGLDFANEAYSEAVDARNDLIKFCNEERIECKIQMTGRFTGAMNKIDYEIQSREVDALNKIFGHNAYMVQKKINKKK